jgi:mannosyl-oligosaccharide alpha-1,2-mannosidase
MDDQRRRGRQFDTSRRRFLQAGALGPVGSLLGAGRAAAGIQDPAADGGDEVPRGSADAIANDVRSEYLRAWEAYKEIAFPNDELHPKSETASNWLSKPLGLTIVESIDTLYLMGADDEVQLAVDWVTDNLDFDVDGEIQVFEATIRYVGGLLAGYHATGEERLVSLARDLADRLLPAFDSRTGLPYRDVNLRTGEVSGQQNFTAEIGTLHPEWCELSRLTGDPTYGDVTRAALKGLYDRRSALDLVGTTIDVETGRWTDRTAQIDPPVDSFYEYLWDTWTLFGDREARKWYRTLERGILEYMAETRDGELWFKSVNMDTGRFASRVQSELTTFMAGLLAEAGDRELGSNYLDSWTGVHDQFGLPPESYDYTSDSVVSSGYRLRPEYAGPCLILYAATGDRRYRDLARKHYRRMKRYCRVENGYTTIADVRTMDQGDLTPGYWFSENMKYLYLTFADTRRFDYDDYYLTTEGNVLRGIQRESD